VRGLRVRSRTPISAYRKLAREGNVPQSRRQLIEARRDQIFPVLEPAEVGRLWRFGELKSYAGGDRIVATGEIAPGAFVILAGRVEVTHRAIPDIPSSS
jgi:hypothetical protein